MSYQGPIKDWYWDDEFQYYYTIGRALYNYNALKFCISNNPEPLLRLDELAPDKSIEELEAEYNEIKDIIEEDNG